MTSWLLPHRQPPGCRSYRGANCVGEVQSCLNPRCRLKITLIRDTGPVSCNPQPADYLTGNNVLRHCCVVIGQTKIKYLFCQNRRMHYSIAGVVIAR
ncbi:DUF2655 domain-containing protein [Morganella morganii]|nr:DUF2655 domain-containing protein [Morganella morganii]